MEYRITRDLITEPVTLDEAKEHIVVDFVIDDALLTKKIKAARQWLEEYCEKAFAAKTIEVYYDYLDTDYSLPIGPIIGPVTSVTRTANDVATVLSNSDYWVRGLQYPVFDFNAVWTSCGRSRTSYSIVYQAGYVPSTGEGDSFVYNNPLPEPIKEAICKLTAELYRDRENSISGTINTMLPHNVRSLVSPYRKSAILL